MYDVVIVGGSYAGMAAALQLARARRKVLVVDAGQRRNRFASTSHGLLGRDGYSPADIATEAREQLLKYSTVTWRQGQAVGASSVDGGFEVESDSGERVTAQRLILAMGISDEMPPVPGLDERWGRSVFHCPYCHGYELEEGPLGVLAVGEVSMHQALLLPDWGPTTLFINGQFEPTAEQREQLDDREVTVETEQVSRVSGDRATVELADGRTIELAGLFVAPRIRLNSPLASQLGCQLADSPMGEVIETDGMKQTTVPGVFACGDAARAAGNVTFAIADGSQAALAAHHSLIWQG
ncbi:NAD(P)/FAD-dependent oxidoreductase [Natronospirillum operosum]|uniref:NAD(P)/FAD-dependent oxidoreductase n=1 Tax=Natronospirillum operosum TaxID=2759953 RepID=A0A4Z0W9J1_9GAMM|nr:NAD(P)/FAD-dependent oxidoreductase [Natronospirillum operosum]TGG92803.1 NAD(P)/FAD-dependent oxidoreductase [Natronospirillum operosum]